MGSGKKSDWSALLAYMPMHMYEMCDLLSHCSKYELKTGSRQARGRLEVPKKARIPPRELGDVCRKVEEENRR